MSSWANRHVVRKRDLSQIPIEFRPDIVLRVERSEVKLSESFQSPLFSSNPFNEIIYPNTNHKSSEPSFIPNSYSSKVIQPPNPLSIDLTYNNKSYVFVILRHIRYPKDNDLWISSYNSIRKHYTNKIVIIDDNSTINTFNGKVVNTEIIKSDFNGAGEILPYYYFNINKWADCMIFLHDSMFLYRPFKNTELNGTVRFHWHFSQNGFDDTNKILNYSSSLKNNTKFLEYIQDPQHKWKGCFGAATIIDLSIVESLEVKYRLFSTLALMIRIRKDREVFERLLGKILYFEEYITDDNCSNFGDILFYPDSFNYETDNANFETAARKIQQHGYDTAIIKVWRGR
jgi:hypothetical protein